MACKGPVVYSISCRRRIMLLLRTAEPPFLVHTLIRCLGIRHWSPGEVMEPDSEGTAGPA